MHSLLRPSFDAEDEIRLLDAVESLLDSEVGNLESAISALGERMELERQESEARSAQTDSAQALAGRRLDGVYASVDSVRGTLHSHRQLLDSLVVLAQAAPAIDATARSVESQPTFADDDEARRIINAEWPPELRNVRAEAMVVVVRLLVREDGTPLFPVVARSSGFAALDSAALRALPKIRWTPAKSFSGLPMSVWVTKPIRFEPGG